MPVHVRMHVRMHVHTASTSSVVSSERASGAAAGAELPPLPTAARASYVSTTCRLMRCLKSSTLMPSLPSSRWRPSRVASDEAGPVTYSHISRSVKLCPSQSVHVMSRSNSCCMLSKGKSRMSASPRA